MLADIKPLARLLGLPYFPVTPTVPVARAAGAGAAAEQVADRVRPADRHHGLADDADDPMVVFNLADQVRETIQQTLHELLERRPDPFG